MKNMKINPREITLCTVFNDLDSEFAQTHLRPRPDVIGEQIVRPSTIAAIESLLKIRDLALDFARLGDLGTYKTFLRDFREAFCLPPEEPAKGGDVFAIVSVSGEMKDDGFHLGTVEKTEFYKNRQKIDLPFRLEAGDRMIATVVHVEEGKSDEVVGRSETFGPLEVTSVLVAPFLPKPKTTPLAVGCSTCGKPLDPRDRPAVEEVEGTTSGAARRWKCAACVMSGLSGVAEKPEAMSPGGGIVSPAVSGGPAEIA